MGWPSLFIVSLPRSLSTVVHQHSCAALSLRSPRWTSAGEILNGDRLAVSGAIGPRFTLPKTYLYEQLFEFLDDVVNPIGYCYKDVVQPFVVSGWLASQSLRVLRIDRPLADVAWSMQRARWDYPALAAADRSNKADQMLDGLLAAYRALKALPAETIAFDEMIADDEVLRSALGRLYPEFEVPPIGLVDESFVGQRDSILERRNSAEWKALEQRLNDLAN
ncbi:MAG TPA: hypothetical protein VI756_10070 [Blastocatellia bacterium]